MLVEPTLTNKSGVFTGPDNDEGAHNHHRHSLTDDIMPEHEETFVGLARQRSSSSLVSNSNNSPVQWSQVRTRSQSTPSTLTTLHEVQDSQRYPRSARIQNGSIYKKLLEQGLPEEVAYKRQRMYNLLYDVLGSSGDEMEKGPRRRRERRQYPHPA